MFFLFFIKISLFPQLKKKNKKNKYYSNIIENHFDQEAKY